MARAAEFGKHDLPSEIEDLGRRVIGAAMEVHTVLGPGLLESVYEGALVRELELSGVEVERQVPAAVEYKGVVIGDQRLDLVIEKTVIVELKVVQALLPVHRAQLLSYLRVAGLPLGFLINFNAAHLRDGFTRVINERSPLVQPSRPSRPSR